MAYKSQFEEHVAKAFKAAGIKFEYEPMVVDFTEPEKKRKYTPDFKARTKAGVLVIETKGKLDRETRKKMILVKEQNPKLNVVILFMDSRKPILKGSKTTYGDWATKNGFKWYDFRNGGLPKEWIK